MNLRSGCDHKAELIAQAQAYLQELHAATQAARERVYAGVAAPFLDAPGAAPDVLPAAPRIAEDPIFATREFELPESVLEALEHGHR
ncbi:MAG TPA: hypothetical protein VFL13_00620 [Candidatus Baltobacteraceae bacterium]|nr:hypothetical protein [Candidatus Baltobacteraceae bacterium]